jgi:site-specific recombinase XerC
MHILMPGGDISLDGQLWIPCRPGFFLPVRILSRLFRRLFLEQLLAAYLAGQLQFFGNQAALADPKAFEDHLAPLHKTECRIGGDVAAPTHHRSGRADFPHKMGCATFYADALLAAPDQRTAQGRRDHALLRFLYNTGARASEAAQVKVADLDLNAASAKITGKGGKQRFCPLWPATVSELAALIGERVSSGPVFLNCHGCPITRFAIHGVVERNVLQALPRCPLMTAKRVSPHSIRHTSATHLLRAGVDINTIRGWLGHVSLETTNIYAEVDFETKAKALAKCDVPDTERVPRRWGDQPALMDFLRTL